MPQADGLSVLRRAEERARQRLAADGRTAALADATFEPVPDGLSNYGWRVRAAGADCFVRLGRDGMQELGADPHAECAVLQVAARAGIAPQVVRCDPAGHLLVTRWVETRPTCATGSARIAPGDLAQVAGRLAELHGLAPPAGARVVDFADRATRLESLSDRDGSAMRLQAAARGFFDALAETRPRMRLCHHDLHARNMLFDGAGRLWLIDWEYAGLDDPVYDLASYSRQHALTAAQRLRLLETYRRAGGSDVDPARLEWACWTFDYVQWLWYRAARTATGTAAADASEMDRRARALRTSLRRRARILLRCNNRRSTVGNARV